MASTPRKNPGMWQDNADLRNLGDEVIRQIMAEIEGDMDVKLERGLSKAAEHLINALEIASPIDTGEYQENWKYKANYHHARYVGNVTMVNRPYGEDGEMPLSVLLEHGTTDMPARPHIKKTVAFEKDEIQRAIAEEMNK